MQRRAFERIPSNLKVRFSCCDTNYEGTVINLSENGMLIITNKVSFPFESNLELLLAAGENLIKVDAKVSRIIKSMDEYDGFGAEVIDPPRSYIEFVNNLKSSL